MSEQEVNQLPVLPNITSSDRVLVFSPHPDDETLACGGLIQKAKRAGARVHVVFMTNGDAFRAEMQVMYKTVRITPQLSLRFGRHRQEESKAAAKQLGLTEDHLTFLGYPDKGMMHIWESNWSPGSAYNSLFTKTMINPYENAPSLGLTYCGQNLLHDVDNMLDEYKPTKVFVVMPGDDHTDHGATTLFVTAALARMHKENVPFARTCQFYGYIVHFGDWPYPQGYHPGRYSAPPSSLMDSGMRWFRLPLTTQEVEGKSHALNEYKSQLQLCDRFLRSFVRTNEQFAQLPVYISAKKPVTFKEPTDEDLMPMLQPGADFKSVSIFRNGCKVSVTLNLKEAAPNGASFKCMIRALNDSTFPPNMIYSQSVKVGIRKLQTPDKVQFEFNDIPSQPLLGITAVSYVAGVKVDKILDKFVQ